MLDNKLNMNLQWRCSDRKIKCIPQCEKLYTGLERCDTFVYEKTIVGM